MFHMKEVRKEGDMREVELGKHKNSRSKLYKCLQIKNVRHQLIKRRKTRNHEYSKANKQFANVLANKKASKVGKQNSKVHQNEKARAQASKLQEHFHVRRQIS